LAIQDGGEDILIDLSFIASKTTVSTCL